MPSSGLRVANEYSFCTAAIGCTWLRSAQRGHGDFRQPDAADFSRRHCLGQGADGFLDGNRGVQPVQVVEVDAVGLQPLQRRIDLGTQGFGPPVDLSAAVDEGQPALGCQEVFAAALLQVPPDEVFAAVPAVEGGGVQVVDPGVKHLVAAACRLPGPWGNSE